VKVGSKLLDKYQTKSGIHFLDANPSGRPVVVLLHGLGVDGSSWGYQIVSLMQAGLRPLAPDLPGFGRSQYDGKGWSIRRMADQVSGLLDSLHIQRAGVVGLSLGGTIALQLALDNPDRVEHLVLMNTFACLRPRRLSELGYLLGRFFVANLRGVEYQANMVAQRLFPEPEKEALRGELVQRICQSDPQVYRAAMRSLGLFDVRRRLKEIRIPTTILTAENDTTVSRRIQGELVHEITGARQVLIPCSGHAVIVDQPERVSHALIEIFTQT
jgi:3-oxoadipate enol-lactonase